MRQAALLVALACLVVAPLAGAVVGPAAAADDATAPSAASAGDPQLQAESLDQEGVHIAVQLEEDGDARWNVSATYILTDENDTAAFDRIAAAFKAGETDNGFSVDVFEAAAPDVSDRVGRPMEITDDRRAATTVDRGNNSTGVLSLQFTWTNFAAVDNETMTVDSFAGSWFGDLQAGQSLSIRAPDDYDPDTVEPTTNVVGGAYQWEGPQTFGEGEPSLVFTSSPLGGDGGVSMLAVGGVVAAAGLVGVGVWLYRRSSRPTPGQSGGGDGDDSAGPTADGSAAGAERASAGEASGSAGASDANGGAGAGGNGTADGSESAGAGSGGGVDPELLSDEERVERLLAEHGGRMKQSKIVEETRWSTAKVSQLLSSMADEDRVEKLRIGRENLISLPGEGIDSGGEDDR
ncbi:helix-turn-helix transcriptional regulator [Halobacterium rubrum]|uniref:helix-turn-helix transcriptional regulator n=1 Tax=Halobacterium TaxID=2239 RepID=UPI001F1FBEE7|nr:MULTISPECIES: hypothetical protein [Halobacterium]MDH5019078.1 hypothetical protein [Halobacterium rubrum]